MVHARVTVQHTIYIFYMYTYIAVWIEKLRTSGKQKNTEKCVGESSIILSCGVSCLYIIIMHTSTVYRLYVTTKI